VILHDKVLAALGWVRL